MYIAVFHLEAIYLSVAAAAAAVNDAVVKTDARPTANSLSIPDLFY